MNKISKAIAAVMLGCSISWSVVGAAGINPLSYIDLPEGGSRYITRSKTQYHTARFANLEATVIMEMNTNNIEKFHSSRMTSDLASFTYDTPTLKNRNVSTHYWGIADLTATGIVSADIYVSF